MGSPDLGFDVGNGWALKERVDEVKPAFSPWPHLLKGVDGVEVKGR